MKIKLKDLSNNPFKIHINGGKLNKEKIELLKESIKKDGFWDNVICRKQDGKYEIAYGHHRLEAAKQVLGKDYELDIPIRKGKMTNAEMIRIMLNENNFRDLSFAEAIDSIMLAKRYLETEAKAKMIYEAIHNPDIRKPMEESGIDIKAIEMLSPEYICDCLIKKWPDEVKNENNNIRTKRRLI